MGRLERSVRVWASSDVLEILWAEDHPGSDLLKEWGLRSRDLEEPVLLILSGCHGRRMGAVTEVERRVCVARRPVEATGTDKRWNERNGVQGDPRGPGMLAQERADGELALQRKSSPREQRVIGGAWWTSLPSHPSDC